MRLQLDSTQLSSVESRQTEAVGANGAGHSSGRSSGAGDSISLSSVSNALHQFTADRTARISQLAASVQNGSYNVSSSKLSAAIVSSALA
jgi:anti-sigma28 factor (negative regulator of flagellin synthesis)